MNLPLNTRSHQKSLAAKSFPVSQPFCHSLSLLVCNPDGSAVEYVKWCAPCAVCPAQLGAAQHGLRVPIRTSAIMEMKGLKSDQHLLTIGRVLCSSLPWTSLANVRASPLRHLSIIMWPWSWNSMLQPWSNSSAIASSGVGMHFKGLPALPADHSSCKLG